MNTTEQQLPLFTPEAAKQVPAVQVPAVQVPAVPVPAESHPLTVPDAADLSERTPIARALGAFEAYMQGRGFTANTQTAFLQDMQILVDHVGKGKPLAEITPATLNAFLHWMQGSRGVPCSPKTLERRITTLKVFFGWLSNEGILPRDVAAPLIHHPATPPLPLVLSPAEIQAMTAATQAARQGGEHKPDARPHLIFILVLHTAIKKAECMALELAHLDLTDRQHPALWVRYRDPRRHHKERRLALPVEWSPCLDEYLQQYPSRQYLFPWSARNLEYVLTRTAQEADLTHISFETLRWTCAVRDFIAGLDREELRLKLGLSEISWYEVEPKLALMAQQYPAPSLAELPPSAS